MSNEFCQVNCIHKDEADKAASSLHDTETIERTSRFFKVFGDPTRIRILYLLTDHELCVCDIAYILGMTHSSISHQLSMLKSEHIVKYRRDGKTVFYSLDDEHVRQILATGTEHTTETRGDH